MQCPQQPTCPSTVFQGFFSFIASLTPVILCPFHKSHSNKCEVTSHCCFDLHFSDYQRYWYLFKGLLAICMYEKCLFRFSAYYKIRVHGFFFSFLLLSCLKSFYILDIIRYMIFLPFGRFSFYFFDHKWILNFVKCFFLPLLR